MRRTFVAIVFAITSSTTTKADAQPVAADITPGRSVIVEDLQKKISELQRTVTKAQINLLGLLDPKAKETREILDDARDKLADLSKLVDEIDPKSQIYRARHRVDAISYNQTCQAIPAPAARGSENVINSIKLSQQGAKEKCETVTGKNCRILKGLTEAIAHPIANNPYWVECETIGFAAPTRRNL